MAVTGAMGDEAGQWRTFGEREVYMSPGVQVRQVVVELAGGERVWRHVVRLHPVALMMLVDGQGRVLLVTRHRVVRSMRRRSQRRRRLASWRIRPGTDRAASGI